ncbi:amidase signature domain-containing protein [Cladorrhinum samala]|uniref:Amidase signature domain-containing protein n=1 Tax=Cladorrhinum samala TaxID=585594 RepID=A0AAV9H5K8_9PEZI|nr:amidase signature domain-containing protein [Cladorrhinum samala]
MPGSRSWNSLGCLLKTTALISLVCPGACALRDAFDVREASIESVHDALFTGGTTCRDVVSSFIARIEEFNPTIHAVISLSPDALSVADQLDERLASGNITGAALFCIPVLLKDNYDAVGTNTTGGCLNLANNKPSVDAPTVTALRNAGAVILGKTNLHEMALEGLTVSSLGGQTINPYDLTRTAGGSSGGAGAAIAANFAILGTGTDTMNSLRSPASANSLFSFRPTRGLISRAGVIPVSFTQDAVGAMARNLEDLAVALTIMSSVGFDPNDNTTAQIPPEIQNKDYSASLYGGSLKGLRLGLINGFFNHTSSPETDPVNSVMSDMVARLSSSGATVINITDPLYDTASLATLDVQIYEFRQQLDSYLSRPELSESTPPVKSFTELYTSNKFLVIPAQSANVKAMFASSTSNSTYLQSLRSIQSLMDSLETAFAVNQLDAIIYPEQKNLVVKIGSPNQAGRNGILAALTGRPVITIPAGFSEPDEDAPVGVPVGMEILGRKWTEGKLLNIARHVTELLPGGTARRAPPFARDFVEVRGSKGGGRYEEVPIIRPNKGNIDPVYPIGVLSG